MDILRGKANIEKFDMIAITESWINTADRHFLPELEIEGYRLFHQDRTGRKGVGAHSSSGTMFSVSLTSQSR